MLFESFESDENETNIEEFTTNFKGLLRQL